MAYRVIVGGEQVGEAARPRLNQKDVRLWSDRVCPLDVERDLLAPAGVSGRFAPGGIRLRQPRATGSIGGVVGGRAAQGCHHVLIKYVGVVEDVGVIISIDDGDRLTGPAVADLVDAVDMPGLRRGQRGARRAGPREWVSGPNGCDSLEEGVDAGRGAG
jgi:hypothetical protein